MTNVAGSTPIPLASGRPSANARHLVSDSQQLSFESGSGDQGSHSSGNVSFSFTHLDAPSPSSYPLREPVLSAGTVKQAAVASQLPSASGTPSKSGDEVDARRAAGWTIVSRDEASANRLARDRRLRNASGRPTDSFDDGEPVVHLNEDEESRKATPVGDVDDSLVLGDLELDDKEPGKRRVIGAGSEAITLYVEDIVKGVGHVPCAPI